MNVLYLSYDGLTDGLGRSQVLPYILGLEKMGHHYSIISFEKKHAYKSGKQAIIEILQGLNIEWFPLTYTASPPIISTVYDVLRLKHRAKELHQNNTFDIVHCRSYITSLAGLSLKRLLGIKFIFDMRAFYADERVDGNLWNQSNLIYKWVYRYFKRKEIQFLQKADYSISLTEKGKEIIHSWKSVAGQPVPIKVIPCCADLDHFNPKNIDRNLQDILRSELSLKETDFTLVYLGSVGTWYLLEEMLAFFKVLLRSKPNAKFLFVTNENASHILTAAKELGIESKNLAITSAKREDVPTYLSLANASIFFIKPVFSKSGSSPTKHGELLGMKIPIIANSGVGDVDRIIRSTETGILVDEFSDSVYQKVIDQVDNLLSIPKESLRNAALNHYSLQEGVKRYNDVYDAVMSNDGTSRSEEL